MTAATDNRPAPQQVTEDEQRAAMERARRGMGRKAWRGSEFVRSELALCRMADSSCCTSLLGLGCKGIAGLALHAVELQQLIYHCCVTCIPALTKLLHVLL